MNYISVTEYAAKWSISDRTVRNHCAAGKIPGAFLTGKTWNIPSDASPEPKRKRKRASGNKLLDRLREERAAQIVGSIYYRTQVDFSYNSNIIEGGRLTKDQTRYIFETNSLEFSDQSINIDDVIKTTNHFKSFDLVIDKAKYKLSESLIKELHHTLIASTSDSRSEYHNMGEYKAYPNDIDGTQTTPPDQVSAEMRKLLAEYHALKKVTLNDIVAFHHRFEAIHPFHDGNGRVGRLIIFKECLAHNISPLIIDEGLKASYYRGLQNWSKISGYLMDACLTAQNNYNAIMAHYRIFA